MNMEKLKEKQQKLLELFYEGVLSCKFRYGLHG